jgi:hypothetical protein
MAEESVFRGVIEFFGELGIYDVVLPFLLVFTIIFAILEKTKILGVEEIEGRRYSKKNINAIIAFVISFLVVASTKLVAVINQALANIVLLILLAVFFLLLVGSFAKEEEREFLQGGWKTVFMIIMFIGIIFIFLDSLDWLSPFWRFLSRYWETRWVASLIMIIAIIIFIVYITKGEKKGGAASAKKEE